MGRQIIILVANNLKLATFMFKLMEHCSKSYDIICVNSRAVPLFKGEILLVSQQLVGTFVASGRTAPHHGRIQS